MGTIASQITSLAVVYSTAYSHADQRKHQSSASLAFVRGIHRDRWIPRTKGQLRGKCFHLMTSSCIFLWIFIHTIKYAWHVRYVYQFCLCHLYMELSVNWFKFCRPYFIYKTQWQKWLLWYSGWKTDYNDNIWPKISKGRATMQSISFYNGPGSKNSASPFMHVSVLVHDTMPSATLSNCLGQPTITTQTLATILRSHERKA